jgi:hypothetical protein
MCALSALIKRPALVFPTLNTPRKEHLYLVLVSMCLLIPGFINPLAQDNDGFLSQVLRYWSGSVVTNLDLRPIYAATVTFVSHFTAIDPIHLYPFIGPTLIIISLMSLWSVIKSPYLFVLTLAAPVISIESFITRPQVFLLAYTIPFLFMIHEGYQRKSFGWLAAATALGLILLGIHELMILYIAIALLLALALAIKNMKKKSVSLKQIGFATLVIAPYLYILWSFGIFNQAIGMSKYFLGVGTNFSFTLWFIDSYTSIDGVNLGWPGIQALYYYAYNGLPLFILIIVLLVTKVLPVKIKSYIPALSFLTVFMFFAEVAPRLGIYALLNRTWPYIALVTLFIILNALPRKTTQHWAVTTGVFVAAATGIIGTTVIATNNVQQVFPEETGVISYLSSLPPDALITSDQQNHTLVSLHANKRYLGLTQSADMRDLNQRLEVSVATYIESEKQATVRETITRIKTGNAVISETRLTEEITPATPKPIVPTTDTYYVYSKRKATGLMAQRTSQIASSNITQETLEYFNANFEKVFEDSAAIVYKLR